MLARSLLLASCAAVASAQLRNTDALVTWTSDPNCNAQAGPRTIVIAVQGQCQRVPNAAAFPGYKVTCNPGGGGSISYCDATCNSCTVTQVFGSPSACLPNDVVRFGNRAVSIQCPVAGGAEIAIPSVQSLAGDEFEVNWFGLPGCGQPVGPNFDRTIVVGKQGLCQRVPNAPGNEGYRVNCAPGGGSGSNIQFCADTGCGRCNFTTPFTQQQCIANDAARYGSASYAIRCPGGGAAAAGGAPAPAPAAAAPAPAPAGAGTATTTPAPIPPFATQTPGPVGGGSGAAAMTLAAMATAMMTAAFFMTA